MANEKEVPLKAAEGARSRYAEGARSRYAEGARSRYAERARPSLYAEGVRSAYSEGVRSVYAEGIGARSAYAEGARHGALDDKTAKVAINVARAQVRSMSRLARLHHRLGRISDYLNKK